MLFGLREGMGEHVTTNLLRGHFRYPPEFLFGLAVVTEQIFGFGGPVVARVAFDHRIVVPVAHFI